MWTKNVSEITDHFVHVYISICLRWDCEYRRRCFCEYAAIIIRSLKNGVGAISFVSNNITTTVWRIDCKRVSNMAAPHRWMNEMNSVPLIYNCTARSDIYSICQVIVKILPRKNWHMANVLITWPPRTISTRFSFRSGAALVTMPLNGAFKFSSYSKCAWSHRRALATWKIFVC